MTFTIEIAMALGVRDRIAGVDAEERRITLSRFDGVLHLERAYWSGWIEANGYVDNIARWAGSKAPSEPHTVSPDEESPGA